MLLACLCFSTGIQAQKRLVRNYIDQYSDRCKELSQSYQIPACIIMATAIVESGAGSSRNARLLNNHFGIVGKNKLAQRKPPVKTKYKQFNSIDDSYIAFCKLICRKRFFSKLKGETDCEKWVEAISASGYSTTPEVWKSQIRLAIRKYHLSRLDEAPEDKTASTDQPAEHN